MASPVAIVTGAASGIGLALTEHLIQRGWNVVMADINDPPERLNNTRFIRTDTASWAQQASLFSKAYSWHNRLDFCALNAGIDDRDDIFNTISEDSSKPPGKPSMLTFDINLYGTYYGIKLASHYLSLDSTGAGKAKAGGKIVVTASAAGIYPLPNVPQYTASKYALVGMVRAMAPAAAQAHITINAHCPALVKTNLAPPGMLDRFAEAEFTPMSTIMQCYTELANLDGVNDPGWVEHGRNGEVVEGNHADLVWHATPSRPATSSYLDDEGQKAWAQAYLERNKAFVRQQRAKKLAML